MSCDSSVQEAGQGPGTLKPTLVVGIGTSAGGITACKRLIEHVPVDAGIAYVIIQHLAPAHESHIAEILKAATSLKISQVTGNERIEPNHIYAIAPATSLLLRDGMLEIGTPAQPHFRARPIDAFFSSLAVGEKERAIGIVLSGTGDDGSAGLKEIRAAGGLCLVQDPETAEFNAMPCNAINTGAADAVVPPEEMGKIIQEYAADPRVRPALEAADGQSSDAPLEGLEPILALLSQRYGLDFRNYKKGTMRRRTERRMGLIKLPGWADYLEHLHAHPKEVAALYHDVLIGVTEFFRDPEGWRYLEEQVVPELLENHDRNTAVRVWSAACATGEEAYSLAMVFLEQIARQGSHLRLQVFASDVSQEALAFARQGLYPASIQEDVTEERLRKFFRRVGDNFQVDRALRDSVTFAAHNLLSDPPFAGLDLVSCRNVLIYLKPPAQERLLESFHFALRSKGILWLGISETNGRRAELFQAHSAKHRMYRPVGPERADPQRTRRRTTDRSLAYDLPLEQAGARKGPKLVRLLEQRVLQRYTSACVAIDRRLEILYFFGPTGEYLAQPPGEARMDLLSWVRPGMYAKLRAGLTRAIEQSRAVTVTDLRLERDLVTARVEVTIEPMASGADTEGLFLVVFRDVSQPQEATTSSVKGGSADERLLHQLEEELKDTQLELQSSVEQLETVNEEYRASHEELLSLNEELQSSNEELETSKEEMQSLNEELMTINRQLEDRNTELHSLTSDLNNLLVSTAVPTIFLDRLLRIRRFTPACIQVMRIVPADLGRSFDHVKLRVQDESLLADAGRVLEKLVPIEVEVSADDDRWFVRRVLPYRTEDERIDGVCITYHDITALRRAAAESEEARSYVEAIIRASRMPLIVLDAQLTIASASEAFYETFQVSEGETLRKKFYEVGNRHWDIPSLRSLLEQVLPRERDVRGYDVERVFDRIGWRVMRINGHVMTRPGRPDLIVVSMEDITDLRRTQLVAQKRADELEREHRRKDEFLAMLGHELRNPLSALLNGVNLIRRVGLAPDRIEHLGAMMERQTRRMVTLLDELLDVGRVISGKLELAQSVVDIAGAARAALETVNPLIEAARHELTVSLPPADTVFVLGDEVRLAQIVENLLVNSAKYTDDGGRIWLSVDATEDSVRLSVRDTGVGMEPGLLEHAFDLFTQAPRALDRAKGGLGIGLALVRSLVEMHRGHVEAFSAGLGQGSEFVITLPRLPAGQLKLPLEGEITRPSRVSHKILVVDDEVDAASALVELLTIEGHTVQAVHDGVAAVDAVREFHPEVVLLDLGLPKLDGYDVAHKLREEHGKQMFIVAMTGYKKDVDRLQKAGFDEHLLKPPDLDELLSLIAAFDARGTGEGHL